MAKLYVLKFSEGEKAVGVDGKGNRVSLKNAEQEKELLKVILQYAFVKETNTDKVNEILDLTSEINNCDMSLTIDKVSLDHLQKGFRDSASGKEGRPRSWFNYPEIIRQINNPTEKIIEEEKSDTEK